ncbi:hypothetical protein EON65_01970 [archaeon]|nr:MAG: hypothetical protein EON65_01970 [archaeon]
MSHTGVLSTAPYMDTHALTSSEMQFSFPAEIIAAQQRQIEALREQVASLQHLVEKLTLASLPPNITDGRNQAEISQISLGSASARGEQTREQMSLLSMRPKSDQAVQPASLAPLDPPLSSSNPGTLPALPTSTWADVMAKEESALIESEIILATSRLQGEFFILCLFMLPADMISIHTFIDEEDDNELLEDGEQDKPTEVQQNAASTLLRYDEQEMSYMSLDTLAGVSVHRRDPVRGAPERVSMYETEVRISLSF